MGNLEKRVREKKKKYSPIDLLEGVPEGDRKKYYGKYVVYKSMKSREILAYGEDIGELIKEARKKGVKEPAIAFIRDPNITYIYSAA